MNKRKLFTVPVALLLFMLGIVDLGVHIPDSPVITHAYPLTTHQDSQIVAAMQRLGLDYTGLNLTYGHYGAPNGDNGQFIPPRSIYLSKSLQGKALDVVLSHEYIHYVQQTHPTEAASFYPYMTDLESRDAWVHKRMAYWQDGTACGGTCNLGNETEAVACTEVPDYALRPDFVGWCDKYLPKRSLLY